MVSKSAHRRRSHRKSMFARRLPQVHSMQRILRDPNTNLPLMVQHGSGFQSHSEPGVMTLSIPRRMQRRKRSPRRR